MSIALLTPPAPEPRRGRGVTDADSIHVLGSLPLFRRCSMNMELWPGFLITISALWMTKRRWRRAKESEPGSGWYPWEFGFFVLAIRVNW